MRNIFVVLTLGILLAGSLTAQIIFSEDFSDNSAGWTLGTDWQIGPATTSAGHSNGNPDPATDNTPTADNGVAGVVIGGNVPVSVHPFYYITSPPINTSTYVGTMNLYYHRWLNSDYTPYMQNNVEVFDGSSWIVIWQSGGAPNITDNAWTPMSHDITAYKNAALQVRFGFELGSSGAYTVSGWNLDDVAIGTPLPGFDVVQNGPAPTAQVVEDAQGPNNDGLVIADVSFANGTTAAWTLTAITFSQTGTMDGSVDINFLGLYEDSNGNGVYDDPATDLLATGMAGTTFTAANGDYTAIPTNTNVPASTTRRFFLVAKLSGSASFGETLGATVTAVNATGGSGSLNGVPTSNGVEALQVSTPVLDIVHVGPAATATVLADSQGTGGNGELLAELVVTSENDSWTVTDLTFSAVGTADEQTAISSIALYEDTNANGLFDDPATDHLATAAAGTSFDAPDGDYVATLTATASTFTFGQSKRFFLMATLSGLAVTAETLRVNVTAATHTGTRGGTEDLSAGTAVVDALVIDAGYVIASLSPANSASATVSGGMAATHTLAAFRFTAFGSSDTLNDITLTTSGTGDWVNDLDPTTGVELYVDDGNAMFDGSDTLVFSGGGAANVVATLTTPVALPAGTPIDIWVRVSLLATAGASPASTFICEIASASDLTTTSGNVFVASMPLSSNTLSVLDFGVTAFAPLTDAAAGGAAITIDGMGFTAPVSVTIGGVTCPGTAVIGAGGTQITGLTVPAGSGQNLPITVWSGGLSLTLVDSFSYPTPKSGSSDGGKDDDSGCVANTGNPAFALWLLLLAIPALVWIRRRAA